MALLNSLEFSDTRASGGRVWTVWEGLVVNQHYQENSAKEPVRLGRSYQAPLRNKGHFMPQLKRMFPPVLLLCLFAGPFASKSYAGRGIWVPIIWGQGETLAQMGKLPPEAEQAVVRELGSEVSVGFLYHRFHLYYADLWTWNGSHVLFAGDKYWTPDAAQWNHMLGESVENKYGKPFLYRFPLGMTLVVSVVLAIGLWPIVFPRDERRLQKLFSNPLYSDAVNGIFPPDKFPLRTTYGEDEFDRGVASLTATGISETKARNNLQTMASAISLARNSHIAMAFQSVEHLTQLGSISGGISILEQLQGAIPRDDPRHEYINEQLLKLREQFASSASIEEPRPTEQV
jgi:hypothetical protein